MAPGSRSGALVLIDTTTGALIDWISVDSGMGCCSGDGDSYYHWAGGLTQYGLSEDSFVQIRMIKDSHTGIESGTLVLASEADRIFWKGGMFDSDLNLIKDVGIAVRTCSSDGRHIGTYSHVTDLQTDEEVVETGVSTYTAHIASVANKLLYSQNYLSTGIHEAVVSVASLESSFIIPVKLKLSALTMWKVKSDPDSSRFYALSSVDGLDTEAYLLEIDSAGERIAKVMPLGVGAADLAVHSGDQRGYVSYPERGLIEGFSMATLQLEKTFGFSEPEAKETDVHYTEAGGHGRLMVCTGYYGYLYMFDTDNGQIL